MIRSAGAIFVCIVCGASAGCALPPISLSTPQPINVNIAMKLDVYQHNPPSAEKKTAASAPDTAEALQERRRRRLGELQPLKNSRLIGENHLGLLEVRTATPGEYGDYVRQTVAAENNDRLALMDLLAKTQKVSLSEMQKQMAENAGHSAFSGEWIETQKPDGSYVWTQKGKE
jgi:hypothetical protein